MHKITQGLKKKKKGKKSKHKEEELFKPEELEAYRREHQQISESGEDSTAPTENEEWKKFNALTAGIDTVLKKTQGDLDRIKSTSFFQRVPTPSERKKTQEEKHTVETELIEKTEVKEPISVTEAAIVRVSESESEDDDEDDIFDTTYIDVIACGEVKLVHIPDSPKEEPEENDPFDTSIAERAILGPSVDKRGKKLVPIGSAVEILTGRVQAPTCISIRRPNTRRQIQKEKDLLLEKFDERSNHTIQGKGNSPSEIKVTLLDDDAPSELSTAIDLSQNLHLQIATATTPINNEKQEFQNFNALDEFQNAGETIIDNNDEFALLAAESLNKRILVNSIPISTNVVTHFESDKKSWNAFDEEKVNEQDREEFEADEDDPFDTTFAENILPGKAELKIIEDEILNVVEDNFESRSSVNKDLVHKVSIQLINPEQHKSIVTEGIDRVSEQELNLIQPFHRDLLGGSSTDLSKLGDQPLQPKESVDQQDYIEYCDPFDTSIIDTVKLPGQTELKYLERELLGELKRSPSDDNFNPREEELLEKQQCRKVSFELPLEHHQSLLEGVTKIGKPLTPYYIRENSIPEVEEHADPFDTSFVSEAAPGKAELKLIENELFEKSSDIVLDSNFNPRDEKQVTVARVVQTIQDIENPNIKTTKPSNLSIFAEAVDLLGADNDVQAKVLTPATEKVVFNDFIDPFDTSIASNILPGKTELKLLESELIDTQGVVPKIYNITLKPESVDRNLFEEEDNSDVTVKPLTPILGNRLQSNSDVTDDIDPFDTTIASNIGLGKTEIKILESELI